MRNALEASESRLGTQCVLPALDGAADGAQQRVAGERLRQEFDGSRLHGLHCHRYVAVTRDEYDRHINPVSRDALLQFKAIDIGKRDVKY